MRVLSHWQCAITLALASYSLGGPVQKPNLVLPAGSEEHRDAVTKIFVDSYEAYRTFAFGHDDLSPQSKSFSDGRNGWGATIVDALPTMVIMGLDDLFAEGLNFSSRIDFSKSQTSATVSLFETTIRYLGGLLSAYELSGQKFPILLQKAKEVADKMAFAWVGDNKIPFGFVNFTTNTPTVATISIASSGTLALEWSTLSKHTGNDTYRRLAEGALRQIAIQPAPLPGLAAQGMDPRTGQSIGGFVSWGGGSDSYFEYLIKYARLSNTDDPLFADTWATTIDSSINTLLRTSTVGNFTYLADFDENKRIRHVGSHLACFNGGNWILGGKLLNNQTIVDIGLKLVDSCINTYTSTATGIGPETFAYISDDGSFTGSSNSPSAAQLAFNAQHGFYITGADYILRPEVLESNFYAWRATGDTKYLDNAVAAIESFNKFLPATVGFAGINDVNNPNSTKIDDTQSFWFAEVLKYLYLTFDDPKHISLDDFVFNTEAQPFIAPQAKATYGSGAILGSKPFKAQGGELPEISPNPALPTPLKEIINPML
ncbi:glycoside hydrolase family 47 protein [Pleurotus ostreatus PC15]|uniref:alpha-1,2-Mannosidase n=1 Tax=Pleurotus ostreatus (strain PC15) TaxID=1137138 RepID=A0A067NUL1_PLEO1|nr:glycoside hydrolase family 47 protein [Pleurotus ostreatus PC15]